MSRFPEPDLERTRRYHAAGQWRRETIPELIAVTTAAMPDKVSVRDASGAALGYRELDEQAHRIAGFLASRGIGAGDIVTVCLPNWWHTVVAFCAILKLGAVINPLSVTCGSAELTYVLGKCRSRALLIAARFRSVDFTEMVAELDPSVTEGLTVLRVGDGAQALGTRFDDAIAHAPIDTPHVGHGDDACAVLFTSGTESRSKGAVHTHNTILFGERGLAAVLQAGVDDVAFMASPISHATGFLHGFVMTMVTGGTLSLLDKFNGAIAARQMREHRCTWTMGATPFLADTVAALKARGETLPDLRYFLCGGAPVPEQPVREAAAIGMRVLSVYGATESPPHTIVHPSDPLENSWLSDGRPLAGIEVRIVAGEGHDAPLGEIGEAWSRGPNTFIGYLDEPELTRRALDAEGWVHSGDLARLLPDGSIRIAGRLKEIIVRGGQNISASEVENHLLSHPAVERVAVVGVAHPRLGETGCAVVVARPGQVPSLEDLTGFLLARGVAKFKLPERLEIWPALPMTPSGKVQKFIIRQRLDESQRQA